VVDVVGLGASSNGGRDAKWDRESGGDMSLDGYLFCLCMLWDASTGSQLPYSVCRRKLDIEPYLGIRAISLFVGWVYDVSSHSRLAWSVTL